MAVICIYIYLNELTRNVIYSNMCKCNALTIIKYIIIIKRLVYTKRSFYIYYTAIRYIIIPE